VQYLSTIYINFIISNTNNRILTIIVLKKI